MRKLIIILGVVSGSVLLAFLIYTFMTWAAYGCVPLVFTNPPKPEITHGEFPFRLVYEKNGKKYVVDDILICDFDGFGLDAVSGKYRKWKSKLASKNTRITLFEDDELEIFYTPDINQHAAAVYMGDTEICGNINEVFPNAWCTENFDDNQENSYVIYANTLWEKYKIKLIDWEIARPIQNTFK